MLQFLLTQIGKLKAAVSSLNSKIGFKTVGIQKQQELTQNTMQYVEFDITIPSGYHILTAYDSSYLAGVMGAVARVSQSASKVGVNYYCTASTGTKNLNLIVIFIKSTMIDS